MKDALPDLNQRIARRVSELRTAQGLSLDSLASRSGVSRSMISLIERGESSPTAVILEKLATGLGVILAALFDSPQDPQLAPQPLVRHCDQPVWRDPDTGYLRRNVSPPGLELAVKIIDIHFPPRKRVTFDSGQRATSTQVQQQVWILEGSISITLGDECHRLSAGDCLAMQLDRCTVFHNHTRRPARYVVVITQPAR